ncbi:MAG: hydrogenase maturation nickel metallochaperone HypA [Bacteroidales bacterium]|jgi:hydrogenase nickel incorporation protein HypA/HybF|nr:hydrogenase maturation nickel metallochaperone HypA [Bacteroidales bacterium]
MHELKIVEELIGIITQVAESENLKKVTKVNIQFGKMIMIVPDVFQFVFEGAVKGTVARKARLSLEILPIIFACNKCKVETEIDDLLFICPYCGSNDLQLKQGREILIESIEGEKSDCKIVKGEKQEVKN